MDFKNLTKKKLIRVPVLDSALVNAKPHRCASISHHLAFTSNVGNDK